MYVDILCHGQAPNLQCELFKKVKPPKITHGSSMTWITPMNPNDKSDIFIILTNSRQQLEGLGLKKERSRK